MLGHPGHALQAISCEGADPAPPSVARKASPALLSAGTHPQMWLRVNENAGDVEALGTNGGHVRTVR